jgi:hypothetical protein
MNFKTKKNNGCAECFINTCLWICIQQYLAYVLDISISISQLRNEAEFNEDYNTDFDFFNKSHHDSIKKILRKYNLGIRFYYANEKDDTITLSKYNEEIFENNKYIIPIVNFSSNNHFELIISGTTQVSSLEEYFDKKKLIIFNSGKHIDLNKLSLEQVSLVEPIIKEIKNIKNNIDDLKFEVENKKNRFYKLNKLHEKRTSELNQIQNELKSLHKKVMENYYSNHDDNNEIDIFYNLQKKRDNLKDRFKKLNIVIKENRIEIKDFVFKIKNLIKYLDEQEQIFYQVLENKN